MKLKGIEWVVGFNTYRVAYTGIFSLAVHQWDHGQNKGRWHWQVEASDPYETDDGAYIKSDFADTEAEAKAAAEACLERYLLSFFEEAPATAL